MKRSIQFVVDGERCAITFEIDPNMNPGRPHMSLVGTYDGGGGQIVDRLREAGADYPEVITLCDLWDAHHLKAPTPKAEKAIGAALEALAGKRLGTAPGVDDAPDVSETDDLIDSRDVIKRIEIYRDALTGAGVDIDTATTANFDPDEFGENGAEVAEWLAEYEALKALENEAEGYAPDWPYGETLIRDSYFEDYAKELADDTGMTNRDARWPNNHIDWTAAAEELKGDYTAVQFRDATYWVR